MDKYKNYFKLSSFRFILCGEPEYESLKIVPANKMSSSDDQTELSFEATCEASASALASALEESINPAAESHNTDPAVGRNEGGASALAESENPESKPQDGGEEGKEGEAAALVTQVDYTHYFIPEMTFIANCPFYWGKIDRYEAEALLENKPEGSFLLRDSAQDEFVFSVSFRRYNRSLHARIEEKSHRFSFDSHDPGVHSSATISGLMAHYKEPLACMFFEPMLLFPVHRSRPFALQDLARAAICDNCSYNDVSALSLPETLRKFVREYSYRHKIGSRQINRKLIQIGGFMYGNLSSIVINGVEDEYRRRFPMDN